MTRFSTPRASAGRTGRRPFSGMARFFESFLVWRTLLPSSIDDSRRGRGGDEETDAGAFAERSGASSSTESREVCCSSPVAMRYWFAASLIAWGVLGVAGIYWYPLHWYSAPTILFGAGIGCIANWLKHRSFHCAVTAPLFLIAAILFLVDSLGIARVNVSLVWSLLFVGTGVAFLLEWKYAKRSGSRGS